MRISDWSSDVCSSDLMLYFGPGDAPATLKAIATAETLPYRLIAVDDVQRLDENGQAALFTLYNRWREVAATGSGFALVLAGDRAPLAMPLDRKSTRLNPVTNAHLVCRLLLEKKKNQYIT